MKKILKLLFVITLLISFNNVNAKEKGHRIYVGSSNACYSTDQGVYCEEIDDEEGGRGDCQDCYDDDLYGVKIFEEENYYYTLYPGVGFEDEYDYDYETKRFNLLRNVYALDFTESKEEKLGYINGTRINVLKANKVNITGNGGLKIDKFWTLADKVNDKGEKLYEVHVKANNIAFYDENNHVVNLEDYGLTEVDDVSDEFKDEDGYLPLYTNVIDKTNDETYEESLNNFLTNPVIYYVTENELTKENYEKYLNSTKIALEEIYSSLMSWVVSLASETEVKLRTEIVFDSYEAETYKLVEAKEDKSIPWTEELVREHIDTLLPTKIGKDGCLLIGNMLYEIRYDANGGVFNDMYDNPQYLIEGNKYAAYDSMVTREGYTFDGWYTEKNGGEKVTNDTVFTKCEDQTLYAHWTLNTYELNIHCINDVYGNVYTINSPKTAKYGEKVNFSINVDNNFTLKNVSIIGGNNNIITPTLNGNNSYSFTMPFKNVGITFEVVPNKLEVPTIKIEKGNNNSLIISWDENKAASKYYIYRSTDKTKGYKKVAETNSNTYTNTGLTYGKTYYYKIYAQNSIKKTEYSNIVSKKVVPNKVTNLKFVSAGSEIIKLSWDKVSTTGYEIYKSTSKSGKYSKVTTVTKNSTLSYTNKKLTGNKTYYYKVRAYKTVSGKKVYGSYSDIVEMKTAPKKTKVSVSLKDYKTLNVKITSVSGASKYEIVRSTSKKGTYSKVGEITSGTYVDTNLTAGKTYYYKVRACNSNGSCGSYSDIKSKKVVPNKPEISASSQETKKVNITINEVVGANGYEVYRSTKKSSGYKKVATVTELNYINSTKKGKTYYYKVRTYTLVNGKKVYSDYSSVKKVKSK